jgi:phosphatidylglycerol---prolipoprotein diacylglyceryl transferase
VFPVIPLGPVSLPTYGLFVAAGYLAAIQWLKGRLADLRLSEDQFWSLIYWVFAGALLGGKLLFLALERDQLASGWDFVRDLRYGFVFYGGFIGATLLAVLRWRKLRFDFWRVADHFAVALSLGHAIGRLGCLAAGCCYGRFCSLPWGLALGGSPESITPRELWGVPLHPTQLYESAANLGIFFFLRKRAARGDGSTFLSYVALYALARFLVEFFRGDPRGALGPLSTSQIIALIAAVCALAVKQARVR